LYVNNGEGEFAISTDVLPDLTSSGSCVIASDYDQDGDLDLFVGGRFIPERYPFTPKSYLLENRDGRFMDVSNKLGDENGYLGMVTSAVWTDLNSDQMPDLMVVGEYMSIMVLTNQAGSFNNKSDEFGLTNTEGWWNSIHGADLDNDGDIDYVVGNYGLNSFFKPTKDRPVEIFANDFDNSGSIDPITTVYFQNESYVYHPRNLMIEQIPGFEGRFRTFEEYGTTPFNRSFTKEEIASSFHLKCKTLSSVILEQRKDSTFKIHYLPNEAQFAPVYGISIEDLNHDNLLDLVLVGNSYAEETLFGYYDASYGSVLLNEGDFSFHFLENYDINFVADGDKKSIARLMLNKGMLFLISENNGRLQFYENTLYKPQDVMYIRPDDWYAIKSFHDGSRQKIEFYYGNGYLSQNSRALIYNQNLRSVEIVNYAGQARVVFPNITN
jgi:hypothetical protein